MAHHWGFGQLQAEHYKKIRNRKGARGYKKRESLMTALQHERKADFCEFSTRNFQRFHQDNKVSFRVRQLI